MSVYPRCPGYRAGPGRCLGEALPIVTGHLSRGYLVLQLKASEASGVPNSRKADPGEGPPLKLVLAREASKPGAAHSRNA